MKIDELNKLFGNIDLFILDQILKGRFPEGSRILDAGCGEGRNLIFFLQNDYNVYAVDRDPNAVKMAQMQARSLGNSNHSQITVGSIENLEYPDHYFDVLICVNALHTLPSKSISKALGEIFRVLHDDGTLLIKTKQALDVQQLLDSYVEDGRVKLLEPLRIEEIGDMGTWGSYVLVKGKR